MSEYRLFKVIRIDGQKYFDIEYVRDVVTCGECIHRKDYECDRIALDGTRCGVTDDWFCADGEREGE